MFGFFSACAVIFEYFFVAETKGLSEREKKGLYYPGAPYGRKLKPDENPTRPSSPSMSTFSESPYQEVSRPNFKELNAKW